MPIVNLPTGYQGIDELPKQRELLLNLYNTGTGIVRTPGVTSLITSAGDPCRGADTWAVDGAAYFVIGTTLYKLNSDETRTSLGTIPGTEPVIFSGGQVQLVIMVVGGQAFTYDASNGLEQIVNANFLPSVSVDFIDGRHVFVPADGSPAIYSEVDDAGTFDPLAFFDAEELPDINQYLINVRNQLFIMGTESTEIFNTTGEADAPFSRRSGSRIDFGYVAGAVRYKNTFCFIGRARSQAPDIYMMVTGDATPITNPAVVEDLLSYTKAQLQECKANRFKFNGLEFITFTFYNRTYAFCEGNWVVLDSNLNGSSAGPWRVNGIAYAYGKYYVGDLDSANIGILADVPSEYGGNTEYQIDTWLRTDRGTFMRPKMLEAEVLTGQNGTTIGLSLSRDGRIKSDYHYRNLGSTGNYQRRVTWRPSGGLGRYESFMGISLRGTGQVKFGAEAIAVT